jgi:hypothetical protein
MDNFHRQLSEHVKKKFDSMFKFESAMVTEVDEDTGKVSTNKGYRENGIDKMGVANGEDVRNGQAIIQLHGSGNGGLPISLGTSDWFIG